MDHTKILFEVTEKFPKRVRGDLSKRINDLGLEIVGRLITAQYEAKTRRENLAAINIRLEQLRVLVRIGFEVGFVSHASLKRLSVSHAEMGRMLGGWIKQQAAAQ